MAEPAGKIGTHILHDITARGGDYVKKKTDRVMNALLPDEIPGIGEMFQLYITNRITHPTLTQFAALNNVFTGDDGIWNVDLDPKLANTLQTLWGKIIDMGRPLPTEDEIYSLWNRGVLSDAFKQFWLQRKGWDTDTWQFNLDMLYREIPGPSDLVRFVVRDVWDPQAILQFQYYAEYPADAEQWLKAQGLIYDIPSPIHDNAGLGPFNWGKAYWWAHWNLPSPTQASDMLHRLRPSDSTKEGPRDPSGQVFTPADMDLLLKVSDYPPYWRPKLAAISYRPVGIRNMRAMLETGVITRDGVYEYLLDEGYNTRDAATQADFLQSQKQAKLVKGPAKAVAAKALEAYSIGIMSGDDALIAAHRAYIPNLTALEQYDQMGYTDRLSLAKSDYAATQDIAAADWKALTAEAKEFVNSLHKRALKGHVTENEIRQLMAERGFTATAIQQYINLWYTELDKPEREMSTGEIQKLARYGIISADDTYNRLTNLGWSNDDAIILMADVQREVNLDIAKAQLAAARTAAQQVRAAQAIIRAADQAKRRARADLARHGSPGQLKKWAIDGKLSVGDYINRMAALGWPTDDITREMAEIQDAINKRNHTILEKQGIARKDTVVRGSIATLVKWARAGVITMGEYTVRMQNLGVPDIDIPRYLVAGGAKVPAPKPPKPPKPPKGKAPKPPKGH